MDRATIPAQKIDDSCRCVCRWFVNRRRPHTSHSHNNCSNEIDANYFVVGCAWVWGASENNWRHHIESQTKMFMRRDKIDCIRAFHCTKWGGRGPLCWMVYVYPALHVGTTYIHVKMHMWAGIRIRRTGEQCAQPVKCCTACVWLIFTFTCTIPVYRLFSLFLLHCR